MMMSEATVADGHVLVVDDDPDIRSTIADILALRGYKVTAAANGLEALEHLRKGLRPCVILLDLMMPILNGWEFCAEQRRDEALAALPVVIISGDGSTNRKAADLGVTGFLRKPLELAAILEVVQAHCH
jgi:CheY-like chemotaxis protein